MSKRRLAYVAGIVAAGLFLGIIGLSIGVGSAVTSLNTVMSPLVCPGDHIVPAWEYRGKPRLANGPELGTRWICVNRETHEAHVAGYRTIFTAGTVYGLILSAIAIAICWRRPWFRDA